MIDPRAFNDYMPQPSFQMPDMRQYSGFLRQPAPAPTRQIGEPMDLRPPDAEGPKTNALGGSGINPLGMFGGVLPMLLQGLFSGGGGGQGGDDSRRRQMMARMLNNKPNAEAVRYGNQNTQGGWY